MTHSRILSTMVHTVPALRRINGFSLMELLIAVGMVALLTSICVPVIASVRGAARRTQCASNLRQIGQAMSLYASDHNDLYPLAADAAIRLSGCNHFCHDDLTKVAFSIPMLPMAISRYVKAQEIWRCPSDRGEVVITRPHVSYPSLYDKSGVSYYYNVFFALRRVQAGRIDVDFPLLWDAGWHWHGHWGPGGRGNVLFEDGHVKGHTLTQFGFLFSPGTPPKGTTP